jgi:NAD(P)-dependent dehydrogenase (short-subunit alcohol dehydrogenase family)
MKVLQDQVIAITGAGSGVGRATALQLARKGARLSLADVDEPGLAKTARSCEEAGANTFVRPVDVADPDAVQAWADGTRDVLGPVHAVINNAGVSVSGAVHDLAYEDYEWIMGINFRGVVHGCRAFLPYLRESGDGRIINVASLFSLIAMPGASAYNASKFAVRGFTESLSAELRLENAPVRVTCVHPGGIDTNIIARGRVTASRVLGIGSQGEAVRDFRKLARTRPETAARKIVQTLIKPRRRVLIGADARWLELVQRLAPVAHQSLVVAFARKQAAGKAGTGGEHEHA